jgi:hypothetical protein
MSSGTPTDGAACITDLAPTTSIVQLPANVDDSKPLQVMLVDGIYGGTLTLPPHQTPDP